MNYVNNQLMLYVYSFQILHLNMMNKMNNFKL